MFNEANAAIVGGSSLIVGGLGLIVSIGGFWITLVQLFRTRRATHAVEEEVARLKNRMALFDFSSECVRAAKSLEHSTRLLKNKQLQAAASELLEAQSVLNRISTSNEGSDAIKTVAKGSAKLLLTVVQDLEDAFDKQIDYNSADLTMSLRKNINLLDLEITRMHREL